MDTMSIQNRQCVYFPGVAAPRFQARWHGIDRRRGEPLELRVSTDAK
jgi:hypothetical protein